MSICKDRNNSMVTKSVFNDFKTWCINMLYLFIDNHNTDKNHKTMLNFYP